MKVRIYTMKNLNNNINRAELNEEELLNVNGGNWLTDAWDATCDWVEENKGVVVRSACIVGGIALCATGLGVGAGLGLIVVQSVGAAAIVSTGVGSIGGAVAGALITEDWED